ncbi:MAG: AraC family transcriptional regulator [Paenibacillaceae bacterium]|nr:AraC family transcriptional regulator [Paenibacillaceae bacterium]
MFPEYQDALALNKFKRGQLPLYISVNPIGTLCKLHHHDFAELSLVIDGFGTETVNGKTHALRPGTVTLLLPHHMHELRCESETPLRLFCCMFDIELMTGSKYESAINRTLFKLGTALPSYCDLDKAGFSDAVRVLEELQAEYDGDRFGRDAVMRAKLFETVTIVLRRMLELQPKGAGDEEAVDKEQLSQALQFVHMHYNEPITLGTVAHRYSRHVSSMSRMFKLYTGHSFQAYLHQLRVTRAATLLATTSMPLTEVALEAGFANYRTFTRVFRQLKGASPSAYRDAR